MKIRQVLLKTGKTFKGEFYCEHCGHRYFAWFQDSELFGNLVMPAAICPKCGKNSFGETKTELVKRIGKMVKIEPAVR